MPAKRRTVLRSIGAGTAFAVGGSTAAGARQSADETAAEVRVLHASPDAPAVDVFIDGSRVVKELSFKTVTGYLSLPPGEIEVAVAPAGAGIDNAVIGPLTLTLEAETDYTVAAINKLADITATVFVDDNHVPAFDLDARLRVVHLSPDAPAVDVAQTDGFGTHYGPEVVASGLSYQNATGYLELFPSHYEFEIRPAGSEDAVFSFDFEPEFGATYTAFAVGSLDPASEDQGFDVITSEDVPPLLDRLGHGE